MWIFINNQLVNIFNIKAIKLLTKYPILTIEFKDASEKIIIRFDTFDRAKEARDLILEECNGLTSMLPRLILNETSITALQPNCRYTLEDEI